MLYAGENWTVYIHIFPNHKYYVGITSFTPEKRWGKEGAKYLGQSVYSAIQKYKWENIEHFIFAKNLTFSEATNIERILIDKLDSYKNGYNDTLGGEGHLLYSFVDKQKMLDLWNQGYRIGEIEKITKCNRNTIRKILENLNIPIEELNQRSTERFEKGLDEIVLKLWNENFSTKEIAKQINRSTKAVFLSLNRLGISQFEKNQHGGIVRSKPILQYNENGLFLHEYTSAEEAAKSLNKYLPSEISNIRSSCTRNNGNVKAYGYYWRYKENSNYPLTLQKNSLGRGKVVYIFQNDNLITTCPTIKAAAEWLIANNEEAKNKTFTALCTQIGRLCKRKNNQAYGFIWSHSKQEE